MKQLGPHFVPLHLGTYKPGVDASVADLASAAYYHWRSMIDRSRGRGFRLAPGTGSKRKHPRNPRPSEVGMILQGLQFTARYGSKEIAHAQPAV